jgi:hypothetical protein
VSPEAAQAHEEERAVPASNSTCMTDRVLPIARFLLAVFYAVMIDAIGEALKRFLHALQATQWHWEPLAFVVVPAYLAIVIGALIGAEWFVDKLSPMRFHRVVLVASLVVVGLFDPFSPWK